MNHNQIAHFSENNDPMFRGLVESLSHVVFTLDDRGYFTYLSPQCEAILGVPPGAVIGKPITSVVIPADREKLCSKYQEVRSGRSYPTDYQVFDNNGGIHLVRAVSRSYESADGKRGVVGVISEISNWQTAEEALRASEEKVKKILSYSKDGIVLTDETGILLEWSPAMEQITGIPRSDALGNPIWDLQYAVLPQEKRVPDSRNRFIGHFNSLVLSGENQSQGRSFEYEIERPNKTRSTIESIEFLIPAETGTMVGAIVRDITDRKRSENSLMVANRKLKLLSGITRHDISNQLMVLQSYLSLLDEKNLGPSDKEYVRRAVTAAKRTAAMIQFTREYEEIGVDAPVWQDFHAMIDNVAKQVQLGPVTVKNDLPAGSEVFSDPLIVKVCYNLVDNAVRYGGKITTIRFFLEERDGNLTVVCEDDGDGVLSDEKQKIFERGYGKNTGLGLALSREILDITGIAIRENGEHGRGARFELAVPKDAIRFRQETG